jgi:hypothetical protein
MRWNSIAAVTALALLALGANARAEDTSKSDQFAQRLLAGKVAAKGKTYACFTRRYDAAHLAKHPEQKVTAMRLLVNAEILPEDKELNYGFQLAIEYRGRKGKFETSGSCGHPSAKEKVPDTLELGCGVDCDGGGLSVELTNGDKSTLIGIDRVAVWDMSNKESERTGFDGGADDHLFRLDRTSLDACRALIQENEEPKEESTDSNS